MLSNGDLLRFLAGVPAVFILPLLCGSLLWRFITGKNLEDLSIAEWGGQVYLLGLAGLGFLSLLNFWVPSWVLILGVLVVVLCQIRTVLATLQRAVAHIRTKKRILLIPFLLYAVLAFAIVVCPATGWDAYTLHYAIVQRWSRSFDFWPDGLSAHDYGHLNGQLLFRLWFKIGNETLANFSSLVQTFSFGASFYSVLIRWKVDKATSCLLTLMLLCLPVVVGQASGGWLDVLLTHFALQATICALDLNLGLWGVFAGAAWATKQSAPALLLPSFLWLLISVLRGRLTPSKLGMGMLLSVALWLPWIYRTTRLTGNPLYPALPSLTRIDVYDLTRAGGTGSNRLGSFQASLVAQNTSIRLFEDGIPVWVILLVIQAGLVNLRRLRSERVSGLIVIVGVSFSLCVLLFPSNPRYSLFAWVYGLLMVGELSSESSSVSQRQPVLFVATFCSLLLGFGILALKVSDRVRCLVGLESRQDFVTRKYPGLIFDDLLKKCNQLGGRLVVVDGITFRLPIQALDVSVFGRGPCILDWTEHHSLEAVMQNLRENDARYILLPLPSPGCRLALHRACQREYGSQQDLSAVLPEFAPNDLKSLALASGTTSPETVQTFQMLLRLKPYWKLLSNRNGVYLYRIISPTP